MAKVTLYGKQAKTSNVLLSDIWDGGQGLKLTGKGKDVYKLELYGDFYNSQIEAMADILLPKNWREVSSFYKTVKDNKVTHIIDFTK